MNWNGDKNKIILVFLIVFFMACFLTVYLLNPGDNTVILFIGGLVTASLSALTRDMKSEPSAPPPGTTTTSASSVQQKTETPATPLTDPPPAIPPPA